MTASRKVEASTAAPTAQVAIPPAAQPIEVKPLPVDPSVIAAAKESMQVTGCPASITLAQYCLESGYGKYLAAPNNPFGIKWFEDCGFPVCCTRTHEWNGTEMIPVEAQFIAFPTLETAFDFHGKMLMNPKSRFAEAVTWNKSHDAVKFLQRLAPVYATDPQYFNKIMALMDEYNLRQFDA